MLKKGISEMELVLTSGIKHTISYCLAIFMWYSCGGATDRFCDFK